MKRKEYLVIGVTQDNDAACHAHDSTHNASRKCKADIEQEDMASVECGIRGIDS